MKFRPIDVVQDIELRDGQIQSCDSIDTFQNRKAESALDTMRQGGHSASQVADFRPLEIFPPIDPVFPLYVYEVA
jgi:hypothetical protein